MSEAYSEDELLDMYDEWLDEFDGPVRLAGCEYSASRVLREIDPIAYRVGFHDYLDAAGIDY